MGQIGIRIVNRLVLADKAAQLLAEAPRARLESRVGEPLGGLDRKHGRSPEHGGQKRGENQSADHQRSAGRAPAATGARTAAGRVRSRRLASETKPPEAARMAPNQIHGTSGL